MLETIYIARHGFRLNWVTTTWESPTGLAKDPPLTAFGVSQAQELADHFLSLDEDQRPTMILSSPYYRCLQTSQPTAKALGLPIYVEHGISEWYSPVTPGTGLHPRPYSASDLKSYFEEIDPEAWSSIYYPTRKGEDVDEIHERCSIVMSDLVSEVETRFTNHKRILLVSHAATVIALARALAKDKEIPMRVGCCSLTELVSTQDGQGERRWEVKKLTEADFLTGGVQRDWGFEDIQIANGKVIDDAGIPGSEGEVDEPVGSTLPGRRGSANITSSL
ncbi:phosphoglycerate mutase-like protein [Gymnopus androsaceus JB14]|uniref:Phosphoglycerate mutase-like protein n=1 Tax=Gymnopus androsaceus JB14 TaxID=1447944 RepID=A0A6A4IKQ7_9AGAR|nr:phosphoglycerate mutase-like protein [Gymnopus androsaceus JB14]